MTPTEQIRPYINQIFHPNLSAACFKLTDYPSFFTHPASTGMHHGYIGGLWIHTKEVISIALQQAQSFPEINKDVLIAAALWHDLAKIWDYKLVTFYPDSYKHIPQHSVLVEVSKEKNHSFYGAEPSWKKVYIADTDYKNQIHHISGSTAEFTHHALNAGVERKIIQAVQHAIIGHHFSKEWGSIKQPQTLEAVLLHQADYLSAHFGKTKKNKLQ